jgi:hypothetical protein
VIHRSPDAIERHPDHVRTVPEVRGVHSQALADEPGRHPTGAVHEPFDHVVTSRRPGDVLLQHDLETRPPSVARERNRLRARLEVKRFPVEPTAKGLGVARLQKRVREGLVRKVGPVAAGTNPDSARVRHRELPQQGGKPPLVDERFEALEGRQARRESGRQRGR